MYNTILSFYSKERAICFHIDGRLIFDSSKFVSYISILSDNQLARCHGEVPQRPELLETSAGLLWRFRCLFQGNFAPVIAITRGLAILAKAAVFGAFPASRIRNVAVLRVRFGCFFPVMRGRPVRHGLHCAPDNHEQPPLRGTGELP